MNDQLDALLTNDQTCPLFQNTAGNPAKALKMLRTASENMVKAIDLIAVIRADRKAAKKATRASKAA